MVVGKFLERVSARFATGAATEHSYRSALEELFEAAAADVTALNEPKRVACGAPDLIITRNGLPVGHCEAKDIGVDLRVLNSANAAQKARYLKALPNLVYTNGLDFEFYRSAELIRRVTIGRLNADGIAALPEQFEVLHTQLKSFAAERPQTISSAKRLAELMAGKAALIKDIMANALIADGEQLTELVGQYQGFRKHLIHDISREEFADIYAETIAYGMFAARLHDTSMDTFTRVEALSLLPKSNPFLRNLFAYIAGPTLDERLIWVVDELADVFQACDVHALMKDFGKFTARNDPFLHFYETFLTEYNPSKRKARGVWYTPEPVVNFIIRAVDTVLKDEFGIAGGLADDSKILIDWDTGQGAKIKKSVHRVQILDPATGTGTFLAEVVKQISTNVKGVAEGIWSNYVEEDLIPRLHGFELLMASYAMCHLKLDMMLTDLGYKPSASQPRLGVYLTNSLEEGETVSQDLFAQWLANEAREASSIKRQVPIMCIVSNPPYSGNSANRGAWISDLMVSYKKEPGGKLRLNERNSRFINDDYVKFIRFSEHMINKNGEGVLGFITNHGYLDNPTFRGMRWHLQSSFDKIYILDLHGNTKKKELAPGGLPDKNVFDIRQGVAIIIAVKHRAKTKAGALAEVYHSDLWGTREAKYEALWSNGLNDTPWTRCSASGPMHYFVPKDFDAEESYRRGFSVAALMPERVLGFQTHRDGFAIAATLDEARKRVAELRDPTVPDELLRQRYNLRDNRDWALAKQRQLIRGRTDWEAGFTKCLYRPFDIRFCHLSYTTMDYPRTEIIQNVLGKDNLCLLIPRQLSLEGYRHALVTNLPAESCAVSNKTKEQNQVLPLYLYPTKAPSRLRKRSTSILIYSKESASWSEVAFRMRLRSSIMFTACCSVLSMPRSSEHS